MPFRPERKSQTYKATITVKGDADKAAFRKFRAALKKLVRTVRGQVKETKPRK